MGGRADQGHPVARARPTRLSSTRSTRSSRSTDAAASLTPA